MARAEKKQAEKAKPGSVGSEKAPASVVGAVKPPESIRPTVVLPASSPLKAAAGKPVSWLVVLAAAFIGFLAYGVITVVVELAGSALSSVFPPVMLCFCCLSLLVSFVTGAVSGFAARLLSGGNDPGKFAVAGFLHGVLVAVVIAVLMVVMSAVMAAAITALLTAVAGSGGFVGGAVAGLAGFLLGGFGAILLFISTIVFVGIPGAIGGFAVGALGGRK